MHAASHGDLPTAGTHTRRVIRSAPEDVILTPGYLPPGRLPTLILF